VKTGLTVDIDVSTKKCVTGKNLIRHKALPSFATGIIINQSKEFYYKCYNHNSVTVTVTAHKMTNYS